MLFYLFFNSLFKLYKSNIVTNIILADMANINPHIPIFRKHKINNKNVLIITPYKVPINEILALPIA